MQLTPTIPDELGITISDSNRTAFTGSGALCNGIVRGGISRFGAWDALRRRWNLDRLTFANRENPAMVIIDYNCDQDLVTGDRLTMEVAFDLYVDARRNGVARYTYSNVQLR